MSEPTPDPRAPAPPPTSPEPGPCPVNAITAEVHHRPGQPPRIIFQTNIRGIPSREIAVMFGALAGVVLQNLGAPP